MRGGSGGAGKGRAGERASFCSKPRNGKGLRVETHATTTATTTSTTTKTTQKGRKRSTTTGQGFGITNTRINAASTRSPHADSSVKAYTQLRVLVIGAGVSGLACARELIAKGHKVKVVEGRRRVGGRVNTAHLELVGEGTPGGGGVAGGGEGEGGEGVSLPHISTALSSYKVPTKDVCAVDMGGMFVHGIDDNPIYRLVEQAGIRSQR